MAAPPPYSPLVIRAVALAALASIGQAGDDDVSHLGWLTDDYYLDHCLAEAKLSLYECIAVAKPNYEDVFLPRPTRDEGHRRLRSEVGMVDCAGRHYDPRHGHPRRPHPQAANPQAAEGPEATAMRRRRPVASLAVAYQNGAVYLAAPFFRPPSGPLSPCGTLRGGFAF
ncbi:MAG: hypothetical protein WDM85_14265 [Caulobacteraceae bacterium]